jgi:hypothetical protein
LSLSGFPAIIELRNQSRNGIKKEITVKITVTVDKYDYEFLDGREKKWTGNSGKDVIINYLTDGVKITREMMQPHLSVVGKDYTKPKETRPDIPRIGLQPSTADVVLDIGDSLYTDLKWAAERENISVSELANMWANECVGFSKPEITETTKIFFRALGSNLIEAVK